MERQDPKKEIDTNYNKEYMKIIDSISNPFIVPSQWTKPGDQIEKFSLYDNYTPVKTSSSTTMNNN